MWRWTGVPSALLLPALLACTEPSVESPSYTVADSAGVPIVRSHAAADDDLNWSVAAEPLVRIGYGTGSDRELFTEIRAGRLLDDGGLVVLDSPSNELRFFDAGGALRATTGGPGEGPGEFRAPVSLTGRGDTLVVFDRALLRISTISAEGDFLGSASASVAPLGQTMDLGGWTLALADGTMVAEQFTPGRRLTPGTVDRLPFHLVLGRSATGALDTLGVYGWRGLYFLPQVRRDAFLPLRETVYTPTRDDRGLAVGDTESGRIDLYDSSGAHRLTAQLPAEATVPAPGAVRRERATALEWARVRAENRPAFDLERYRRWLDALPEASRWPAFRRLLVDDRGFVWALPYRAGEGRGSPADEQQVRILHPDGHLLGTLELPGELDPLHAGTDRILSRSTDDLGVQRLLVHRLDGPGR